MAHLTDEQKALSSAYAACFGQPQPTAAVMDDLLIFARSLEALERAGALQLYGHIQSRITMKRRADRKPEAKPAKRVEILNAG